MFELLPESEGNVVVIRVSDVLHHTDYESLAPKLEDIITEHGKIRMLCYMEDFKGWDLQAMWDDLQLDIKHRKDIDKLAIVAQEGWLEWGVKFSRLFIDGEARFFKPDESEMAMGWIKAF